jgi:hypothetical protein
MESNFRIEIEIEPFTEEALHEFHLQFRSYLSRLYRVALILTGRPQSAQELLTAIYVSALENYPQKAGMESFETWLNGVLQKYLQSPSYRRFCLIESGLFREQHSDTGLQN